ncbi:hypothetical protein V500_03241 [Pseudogymnoascus sp. VKM F-4518 (FW-2643)]|nr:hypothetical protein V500_03241 [Pseudogymnoascus sp. VKM F-4518 (FW-2643)]
MPPSATEEHVAFVADDHTSNALKASYQQNAFFQWFRLARPRVLRRRNRLLFLTLRFILWVFSTFLILVPILAPSYTRPPQHYRDLSERCAGPNAAAGCANPFNEQIFIAISLYDKEGYLLGGDWGCLLLELIHIVGESNVFLSIYENDNAPGGTAALDAFRAKLRCGHELVHDIHVPLTDFPTVTMPDGSQRLKRLAYLSELRNRAMRPLDRWNESVGVFDKVLFLNDVFYNPIDAAQLLFSTNVGPDGRTRYLASCALDFNNAVLLYDLYATRDTEGYSMGLPIWPMFSTAGAALSRRDMLAQKDAVRVSSCWSGMVAMQATWVQNHNSSLPSPNFHSLGAHVIDPAQPSKNVTAPVRFRYEPEIFVDACECCLFLADVAAVARRAGARETGIYFNPYVRVAYKRSMLRWVSVAQRWERLFELPQGILSWLAGLPTHNPHRMVKEGESFVEEVWVEDRGTKSGATWSLIQRQARNGMFCEVREMQVVTMGERNGDVNWENVPIPAGQAYYFPT